ncbi:1-phosphofructokinase [Halobacterium zhouii]|uniref:1-phosphofructokinase n=1 Tax=Halobacterium zhouii TaxID=2902624 RepID=UPI001E47A787|nr:1-phosphofructokinase [Halobacterium zhouii]
MILTLTLNPAVDHTARVDEALTPDAIHRADDAQFDPGGKGINVSEYLLELGTETVATGPVGGFTGEFLRSNLAELGVPTDFVDVDGRTRLNTTVLADGEEYKLNHRGPTLSEDAVDDLLDTMTEWAPDVVVVAGSLPPGVSPSDVDHLAAAGDWETFVDVDGETMQALDASYAGCKPNRQELAAATGRAVDDLEGCLAAARDLQSRGFERVVASLGGDGAVMVTPTATYYAPALDVDVVDTVSAGDSLFAGVLSALVAGESDRVALETGVAVAARAVSVPGTVVPTLGGIERDVERVSVSEY